MGGLQFSLRAQRKYGLSICCVHVCFGWILEAGSEFAALFWSDVSFINLEWECLQEGQMGRVSESTGIPSHFGSSCIRSATPPPPLLFQYSPLLRKGECLLLECSQHSEPCPALEHLCSELSGSSRRRCVARGELGGQNWEASYQGGTLGSFIRLSWAPLSFIFSQIHQA